VSETYSSEEQDAVNRTRVETAAKCWSFRVVVSVDLKGAGERFTDVADTLGAAGGVVFQEQIHRFILDALDGVGVTDGAAEGVWQWTGDGALLAFANADLGHDFAMALHGATSIHNRGTRSAVAEQRFRVGMAATDNPTRESWNVTVMRAVRLESKADTDGNLIDENTWKGLHSTNDTLYGPVEQVPGKREDEFYSAHRYSPAPVISPPEPEEPKTLANPRLHNLPPDVAHFKGRGAEEAAILAALKGGGATQAITALKGIGGIGKSALAVRVARQLDKHYPAAQMLVDLRGTEADPLTPRAAMEDVIRRFDPDAQLPDDDDRVLEVYRGILAQLKSLLILDNARDGAQVQSLLPPLPSAAIITSRRQINLPNVISHGLDNLGHADAVALLADLFEHHAPTNVPGKDILERLAAACADHPLALTVAGIYAANHAGRIDLEIHAAQIEERRETLKLAGVDGFDVMAGLALSLDRLAEENPTLAERWRDLAVFPADFDALAAAAVWAVEDACDSLLALEDAGFLEPGSAAERFRLHDLMRDLARLNQREERFATAEASHGAHFLSVLNTAKEFYRKGGAQNALDGLALYDREQANIRTGQARVVVAMKEAASAVASALVYQYANAGAYVLNIRLHPRDQILWWEAAAEGARLSENRRGEGAALGNLGLAYMDLGETDKAIDHYKQALAVHREIGDRRGEGLGLGNLGLVYAGLGETDKAIDHYEQQLVIAREIRDRRSEGNALGNLGVVYKNLGAMDKAIDHYEQQLVIAREIGDRRGEGNALGNLGVAYEILERFAEARDAWTAALVLYEAIDDPNAEMVREWLATLET
jgi:tetratricopeptide (TPR) repeat protein